MNSQKMIRLSVIAALAGVYGSAFAGTTYYKGTNFIDQTYEPKSRLMRPRFN